MRRLGLVGFVCLFVMAGLTATTTSAQAFTVICTGKTKAQVAACDTSGYADVMDQMHWRMYGGHNCTNYAAWRMKKAGVPEPKILMGNARDWHTNAKKLGYVVDHRPAVGAIAQWSKAASHVAYVEQVGPDFLILSEDSYTSKTFRRYKVLTGASWYPERFIHFSGVATPQPAVPEPTLAPAVASTVRVSGPGRVSSTVKPKVTVTVAAATGVVPQGKIRVRRGGVTVRTVTLKPGHRGSVAVTLPKMKRGKQWISAVFDGSAQVRKSTSPTIKLVVTKPPKVVSAKTAIVLPAKQFTVGTRPRATVTVTPSDGRTTTNAVSVYVDGKRIGAPKLTKAKKGKVTVRLPALAPGRHTIRATYWGSKTVRRSKAKAQAFAVVEPTTTGVSLEQATVGSDEQAQVVATIGTARGVAPTAGEVWVLADGVKVASTSLTASARGTARVTLPVLGPGTRSISVRYRGSTYQTASVSGAVPLRVMERSTTSTSLSATRVKPTARAKLTISVHSGRGVPQTSGAVAVLVGGKRVATATLTPASKGKVVVTLPKLAVGRHAVSASFGGTDLLEPSTSAVRTLTVAQ